ncbi:S26 family signal peptidase [uncultured Bartonella sp.]|uniref:S26 family signal peptidase n=1 Tax=uncultured Bartonella sp. TaxID=104108 RepID=UPI002624EA73|nr:S26 family signal peptidase [uncultured Bartonella sp.]
MRRTSKLILTTFAVTLIAASAIIGKQVNLVWNASASVPIGLYRISAVDDLKHGDLALVRPPEALAQYLDRRSYLPQNIPLLKHVAALDRDTVCRRQTTITINSKLVAEALVADRKGRLLPVWSGCITLGRDQVFLLNETFQDSLDGRYFGPLPRTTVIGEAAPLFILNHR